MKRFAISTRAYLVAGVLAACGSAWVLPAPLLAQEVVQALPPREAAQLNAALRRLAQRPNDLDALISAGDAALALHDGGAASGFFARAERVSPNDPRVLLGLARVALEQRRPVEALAAFARAESAGVRPTDMAADRALAYDLVGDNAAAQALYLTALAVDDNSELRRRLALSYAISGNRAEFERTLYPLLRVEDRSAFRTRAFGLAILGRPDDAVEIADAMMPTDLALRMASYLRYMPRLTKSQQAAAGNLGAFPAAMEIGRDPPAIAGYAGAGARIAASANSSLTPAGAPLGPRGQGQTGAPSTARGRPASAGITPSAVTTPAPARIAAATATPARQPVRTLVASTPATAPSASLSAPNTVVLATPAPAPSSVRPSLSDAFADLGEAPVAPAGPAVGAVDVAKLAATRQAEEAQAKKAADAKAAQARKLADAASAKAKKDADAKAKAEQAARDAEPARFWAQVGVGRNTSAFAFDWKRLAKQAGGALDGKGPWAVKYGATNRMLAGPYPTEAAANAAVKRLKDKDIDALPYDSAQGEKVSKVG